MGLLQRLLGRPPGGPDPGDATTLSAPDREAAWVNLRPVDLTLRAHPLTVQTAAFEENLTAHRSPQFLAPLGHHLSSNGPAGLISGLVTPAPPTSAAGPDALPMQRLAFPPRPGWIPPGAVATGPSPAEPALPLQRAAEVKPAPAPQAANVASPLVAGAAPNTAEPPCGVLVVHSQSVAEEPEPARSPAPEPQLRADETPETVEPKTPVESPADHDHPIESAASETGPVDLPLLAETPQTAALTNPSPPVISRQVEGTTSTPRAHHDPGRTESRLDPLVSARQNPAGRPDTTVAQRADSAVPLAPVASSTAQQRLGLGAPLKSDMPGRSRDRDPVEPDMSLAAEPTREPTPDVPGVSGMAPQAPLVGEASLLSAPDDATPGGSETQLVSEAPLVQRMPIGAGPIETSLATTESSATPAPHEGGQKEFGGPIPSPLSQHEGSLPTNHRSDGEPPQPTAARLASPPHVAQPELEIAQRSQETAPPETVGSDTPGPNIDAPLISTRPVSLASQPAESDIDGPLAPTAAPEPAPFRPATAMQRASVATEGSVHPAGAVVVQRAGSQLTRPLQPAPAWASVVVARLAESPHIASLRGHDHGQSRRPATEHHSTELANAPQLPDLALAGRLEPFFESATDPSVQRQPEGPAPISNVTSEAPQLLTATPPAYLQRDVEEPETTPVLQTAPAPGGAPAGGGAGGHGDLDELALKLYDRICFRLRSELRLDRERAGVVSDLGF